MLNFLDMDWYMATGDSNGPFPGGMPTWISGPSQQWETCQADASEVLTSLHRYTCPFQRHPMPAASIIVTMVNRI